MQSSSEQPLVGEERYVTTLITAAKETNALVVCVKSPHSLVPRSFGFLTQTTRAYNPVRRTFYDVNYIYARCDAKGSDYKTNRKTRKKHT